MVNCDYVNCEKRLVGGVRLTCPYCSLHYCPSHRLQEDHDCPGRERMLKAMRAALKAKLLAESKAAAPRA